MDEYEKETPSFSIEDSRVTEAIINNQAIVLAYPIYYSSLPKIMSDFIINNGRLFAGKTVYIIATMGLFSGDGAGCAARLLKKYDARIAGGLHLKMPDSIGDEKVLKKTLEQNQRLVKAAEKKIHLAVAKLKAKRPGKEGLGVLGHLTGLLGQRLWFGFKTKTYTDKLHIDDKKCIGCKKCINLCPMGNISMIEGKAVPGIRCTMCYRCVNNCPQEAITLLGKKVYEQSRIEKYITYK